MKIKMELIYRDVAGESFLVPVGEAVRTRSGLFPLSETGAFLWQRLPEAQNARELADALTEAYDVDADTALADVEAFLAQLRAFDII